MAPHRSSGTALVGVVGPMSGPLAAYGAMLRTTVEQVFAARGAPADLAIHDDAASPDRAETVARELVLRGVRAVIGHFNSACALRVAPLYAAARVPFLAPCTSHPALLDAGAGWALRYCGDDRLQVERLRAWLRSAGIDPKMPRLIHDDTPYARSLVSIWEAAACDRQPAQQGVANEDLRGRIFFGKYPAALAHLRREPRQPGELFVTGDDAHAPAYLCEGGSAVEGTYVVGPGEGQQALVASAAHHLADCLTSLPDTGEALRRALFAGGAGTWGLNGQRREAAYAVFRIEASAFVRVE